MDLRPPADTDDLREIWLWQLDLFESLKKPVFPGGINIGDATNYTDIENDGTIEINGTATVFNDIQFSLSTAKVPAANFPSWDSFTGNLSKFTFAVNDFVDLEAKETIHGYKEGTNLHVHVHIYTNGIDGTARTVKYQVEYTITNPDAVASAATISIQATIPASTADLTHTVIDLGDITGTSILHGADISLQFKRIAKDSGVDPTNNPFVSMVGIHVEDDMVGSRQELVK